MTCCGVDNYYDQKKNPVCALPHYYSRPSDSRTRVCCSSDSDLEFTNALGGIMKTLTLCGTVIFLVYLVVLCSSGQPYGKNWCRAPLRRNWRLPPRPPQKQEIREPKEKPLWFFSPPKTQPLPGRTLLFLYQHINQKGFKYEQLVGPRCYNLPNVINDQASSLDTNGRCVMVCRDRDCKFCKKMQPGSRGHFNLNEIGMDDTITSIKPCGDVY